MFRNLKSHGRRALLRETENLKFSDFFPGRWSAFAKSNDGSDDNNPFNWRPDQIQAQWD